jgi:hypothetical protein
MPLDDETPYEQTIEYLSTSVKRIEAELETLKNVLRSVSDAPDEDEGGGGVETPVQTPVQSLAARESRETKSPGFPGLFHSGGRF